MVLILLALEYWDCHGLHTDLTSAQKETESFEKDCMNRRLKYISVDVWKVDCTIMWVYYHVIKIQMILIRFNLLIIKFNIHVLYKAWVLASIFKFLTES
jgi:hypothetical protein